jgi:hypothetical protein
VLSTVKYRIETNTAIINLAFKFYNTNFKCQEQKRLFLVMLQTTKLERFDLPGIFRLVPNLQAGPGLVHEVWHIEKHLCLTHNLQTRLKAFSGNKRSSLFCPILGNNINEIKLLYFVSYSPDK